VRIVKHLHLSDHFRFARDVFFARGFGAAFGAGLRRGVFQYGDLHFGQTIGSTSASRGTQSCSQRSQMNTVIIRCSVAIGCT